MIVTRKAARIATLAVAAATFLCLVLSPAAQGREPRKGFWGPQAVNGVSQFPMYSDLDVDLFQMAVRWDQVAPTRPDRPGDPADPAYAWPPEVEAGLAEAERYGMKVAILVTGTPGWANGGKPWQWAPKNPRDFAAFAGAASRRYPAVKDWIIWGEPSFSRHFQPLSEDEGGRCSLSRRAARGPRRYAELLDAAYGSLKSVSRSNRVIGGNNATIGTIAPLAWIRYMLLKNGRPPRMDLFGHNPFSAREPDLAQGPLPGCAADFSDLDTVHRLVDARLARGRRKIPLFLSEFTIPTGPDREFNFHVDLETQARWLARAFAIARQVSWIDTLGWIHLYDEPPAGGAPVVRGGLLDYLGRPKPAYEVFRSS